MFDTVLNTNKLGPWAVTFPIHGHRTHRNLIYKSEGISLRVAGVRKGGAEETVPSHTSCPGSPTLHTHLRAAVAAYGNLLLAGL